MADIGYVTLEYAEQYVSTHFVSTDEVRRTWASLSDEDKVVLLVRSFEAIEQLAYSGRKTSPDQPNAFPRWPDAEVPDAILRAQVENAVSLSDSSQTEDAAFYEHLWSYGIQSYSIGNLSESSGEGHWGSSSPMSQGVVSTKAAKLLQPYIAGGFAVRGGKNV